VEILAHDAVIVRTPCRTKNGMAIKRALALFGQRYRDRENPRQLEMEESKTFLPLTAQPSWFSHSGTGRGDASVGKKGCFCDGRCDNLVTISFRFVERRLRDASQSKPPDTPKIHQIPTAPVVRPPPL
jgi:hypothetical protein